MQLAVGRPTVRQLIMLAVVAAIVLAFGAFRPAQAAAPDWQSPATVAARYVHSVQPTMKMTTEQLVKLIVDLRVARSQGLTPEQIAVQAESSGKGMSVPALSYWNSTFWFNHWDVAMMVGLSAAAIVALLLTTGPIGVGTAWAIVWGIISVITAAFFSGYCAYYVVPQRRGGTYHC